MGRNFATELSAMDTMSMEQQINLHLQYNFYPPVPSSMVQPCIDAINAYWNDVPDAAIEMPQGVSYRSSNYAPAYAIVEQHRLDAWLEQDDYDDETDYSNVYYENGEYFNV
jgi:hypothetical protein